FRENAYLASLPLVGETWSAHPAGRTVYLVTMNASRASKRSGAPLRFRVELGALGAAQPDGPVVLYDWRRGGFEPVARDGRFDGTLAYQEWGYGVLAPLLPGEVALFGDPRLFATMGDRRIQGVRAEDGELRFDVLGAPGEAPTVEGFAARAP